MVSSTPQEALLGRLVGIVPAAGYATRLQPLAGSKEVLPIAGKPVMDHLIERMRRAGCDDIRVVTRPEKQDVISHSDSHGIKVVLGYPRSVSESILAGLGGTHPDDVVLFGFPDTIWQPLDGFVHLLNALDGFDVALGLFRWAESYRSDVVDFTDSGLVVSIKVRPEIPTSDWIWGMAVARRRALRALSTTPEPGAVFDSMCLSHLVVGVPMSGPFVDLGTPDALHAYERNASS